VKLCSDDAIIDEEKPQKEAEIFEKYRISPEMSQGAPENTCAWNGMKRHMMES